MKSTSLEVLVKPIGRPLTVKATFLPEPYNIKREVVDKGGEKEKGPGRRRGCRRCTVFLVSHRATTLPQRGRTK